MEKYQKVRQLTIFKTTFWNETLNLRIEKDNLFEIEDKKLFECQSKFHTVDYSASLKDKGRPTVLKIQGWWGEIAFRVRVHSNTRTVGCWVNWIHVWNLNLQLKHEPVLLFLRFKQKRVFLVQIMAHCSTAEVIQQHLQRSHGERPQLSQKSHSDSSGQLTPFFFLTF